MRLSEQPVEPVVADPAPPPERTRGRPHDGIPYVADTLHYQSVAGACLAAVVLAVGPAGGGRGGLPHLALSLLVWGTDGESMSLVGVRRGRSARMWHWPDERCQVYR